MTLTLTLDGCEWSDSCSGRVIPDTIGCHVSYRAGMVVTETRKVPVPTGNRKPVTHPVDSRFTDVSLFIIIHEPMEIRTRRVTRTA